MSFLSVLHGAFGILVLLAIAFVFSNNKRRVNWKLVGMGLLLQISFGILVVKGDELHPHLIQQCGDAQLGYGVSGRPP